MENILKKKIGIVGCGTMGLPMVKILRKNKIDITAHDVKPKENFLQIKNQFIQDKYSFFDQNEIIISAVRDIEQTLEICEGKNGLFNFKVKKVLLISSTLSPLFLKKLSQKAPKNISLIDAPMSGAPMSAKNASLTFMIGCTNKQFRFISPLLKILGKEIKHIGSYGQGMSVKVLNNFVASCTVVAVRNVLSKSKSFGIQPKQLLNVLKDSSGQTWFADNLEKIDWSKEDYCKDNTIGILEKDVKSFMNAINKETPDNLGMQNFQNALVKGLQNIPSFPKKN